MNRDAFAEFVACIRRTIEPVAHLTDAELEGSDLEPPVVRLMLGLRAALQEFEAAAWREISTGGNKRHGGAKGGH